MKLSFVSKYASIDEFDDIELPAKKGVSHHFETFLVFCLIFYSKKW